MSEIPTNLPPKRDVARAFLLRGSVFVHLDPRREGVSVPKHLADQPQVVLQVGLDLPVPILDLRVDDEGVFGTLSFARSPFHCIVPWSAVFALVGDDGKGLVWPTEMPPEIAAEVEQARRPNAKAPRVKKALAEVDREITPKPSRHLSIARLDATKRTASDGTTLRSVPTAQPASPKRSSKPRPGGPKKERPSYLRVVK